MDADPKRTSWPLENKAREPSVIWHAGFPVTSVSPIRILAGYSANVGSLEGSIVFEGTYTVEFADRARPTPKFNYNQILYRLDLDDPRLAGAAN